MQLENSSAQTLRIQQQAQSTNYLINTSKMLKGSKIKTKDFIRVQLMKFKHASSNNYNQSPQQKTKLTPKNIQYKKFMPFGTIEEVQIHQIIANQKQLMSRETKGRIKLFKNSKINSFFAEGDGQIPVNTLQMRAKQATANHRKRQRRQKKVNYSSISDHFHSKTVSFDEKVKSTQVIFRTQNLGGKMNKLINVLFNQDNYFDQSSKQQMDYINKMTEAVERDQKGYVGDQLPIRKKNNVPFMRQMKKHRKHKIQEKATQPFSRMNSEEIPQHFSMELSHRERTTKLQSRANKALNNYSIELRNQRKTINVRNSLIRRQQSQNDSVFESKII